MAERRAPNIERILNNYTQYCTAGRGQNNNVRKKTDRARSHSSVRRSGKIRLRKGKRVIRLIYRLFLPSTPVRLRGLRRVRTVRIRTTAVPRIEVKNVSNDGGAGHLRRIRHHFPLRDEHGPRWGQRVQQRNDEERVRVPGRVRLGREDVLPQLAHALHVRRDVRALFGELCGGEPAHREGFLELGVGTKVLLDRGPDLLCCRGLLEDPEPSVADVDQELQPCAGIAHLPTIQPCLFRWCHLGAIDQTPQSARLQYYLNLE